MTPTTILLALLTATIPLGWWLAKAIRSPKDDRIENLALFAGGAGLFVAGFATLLGAMAGGAT